MTELLAHAPRPRVLCVDDEPHVLEALRDTLRRHFDIVTATSGADALDILASDQTFTIIIADMRMPAMNGAAFLSAARHAAPDAVRMLLTGHADLKAAIAAINDGQIFRFLTKPCARETLLQAFVAALRQHRLLTAERVLLEETLLGSIEAMSRTLALTNPEAFGRATRLKRIAGDIARRARIDDVWEIEIAALLSQLGCGSLGPDTAEKYYVGEELTLAEQVLVERLPQTAARIIRDIPRLEKVHQILDQQNTPPTGGDGATTVTGAQILRIAHDFDLLDSQHIPPDRALALMRGRPNRYDPALLNTLAEIHGDNSTTAILELPLRDLKLGMTLADDVHSNTDAVVVARGQTVTPDLLARLRTFDGRLREPLRIISDRAAAAEAA